MTVMRTKQEKERSREVLGAAHQIGNAQIDPRAEKLIDRLTKERSTNPSMVEAQGCHLQDAEHQG